MLPLCEFVAEESADCHPDDTSARWLLQILMLPTFGPFSTPQRRSRDTSLCDLHEWHTPLQLNMLAFCGSTGCEHAGSINTPVSEMHRRGGPLGSPRWRCVRSHPARGGIARRGRLGSAGRDADTVPEIAD